ncbi:Orotate phosphoribosyltransferase [Tepidimonas thermarum]|uniref:Orotate phosphoribosyltransferase n=1 Tax=Tepidimonas thermarum TaxID=335431 RepID=A0A554WX22_9BURK|nr:Orotate phosphoribosyltransferase [Tepidimonas thermarum]
MRVAWARLRRWLHDHCPALCEVCGRWPDGPLCPDCRRDLAPLLPRCPGCALPLAPGLQRCHTCEHQPPPWETVVARVDFAHPWDAWIRALKSTGQPGLAGALAPLWLDDPAVPRLLERADRWLPIPLAPARLADRGYNQSWALMRALAAHTRVPPADAGVLQRAADAPVLHHLDRAARLAHAEHLFHVPAGAAARVQGRRVLIVDDVMTTGATLRAATRALRQAGAAAVDALVFARTPPPVE